MFISMGRKHIDRFLLTYLGAINNLLRTCTPYVRNQVLGLLF